MRFRFGQIRGLLFLSVAVALSVSGFAKDENKQVQAKNKDGQAQKKEEQAAEKKDGDKKGHEGWWCDEHGVPEDMCSLCLPEADVKKRFKDKNDWCKEHKRAQSQCFKCDPKQYARYEQMYEDKYGQKPKCRPESEFTK